MGIRSMQEIIKAFSNGDHLSDGEMIELRNLYHRLFLSTSYFGERYALICNEAFLKVQSLNVYLKASGIHIS